MGPFSPTLQPEADGKTRNADFVVIENVLFWMDFFCVH